MHLSIIQISFKLKCPSPLPNQAMTARVPFNKWDSFSFLRRQVSFMVLNPADFNQLELQGLMCLATKCSKRQHHIKN